MGRQSRRGRRHALSYGRTGSPELEAIMVSRRDGPDAWSSRIRRDHQRMTPRRRLFLHRDSATE